ncbi:MAG: adenosine deaminase [Verrucomicrobia bacterium]|nr:adenosine deaminase [Verrucomicrobiota bacterium]
MRLPALLAFALSAICRLPADDFSGRFAALRAAATPAQLYALLYDLPKGGDLHNHSGGSDRGEWIYAACTDPARNGGDTFYTRARFTAQPDAIAPQQRFRTLRQHAYDRLGADPKREYVRLDALSPAERAEWCNSLRLDREGEGRDEFFAVIWPRHAGLESNLPVAVELLVENLKAFGAEHLSYLETQFGVHGMIDNSGNPIPPDAALAFLQKRLAQPDVLATGMTVRFQRTILRFRPDAEQRLVDTYTWVDAHRDLWVGLNMAGIEENGRGYPARFLDTYRSLRARFPTLALSIHAGEMDGPDSHIRDTLLLGASRIGHGVNLIKDPATLLLLQQSRRVLVEINLISNRLLEYTPDLAKHPFPEYLRTGVPVCLNTDDRGMWDSNLTDEYFTAVTTFHLSWPEIVELGRNSLAHSFAPPDVKQKLLADYAARVAAFEKKYAAGSVADALARLAAVRPVTYGYAKRTWGLEFP